MGEYWGLFSLFRVQYYFQCEVVDMAEAGSFKGNKGEVPFDSKPRVQPPVGRCPKTLAPVRAKLGPASSSIREKDHCLATIGRKHHFPHFGLFQARIKVLSMGQHLQSVTQNETLKETAQEPADAASGACTVPG